MNIQEGCLAVPYHRLTADFNRTVLAMLEHWGVTSTHQQAILDRAQKHNFSRKSQAVLQKDPHHSSSKFPAEVVKAVKAWIKQHPEVSRLVSQQRVELHSHLQTLL